MTQHQLKVVSKIYTDADQHWVGDGFLVRNFFPSHAITPFISPFFLLDYAGPTYFEPSRQPHGVGEHPHRGFETVTIVFQGKVAHRDSAGNSGVIGPGDVQWMTAASGIVHEEMHEREFAQQGGVVEMVQLWVNLPKAYKMSAPHYQTLVSEQIPTINLANNGGVLRVIAGTALDTQGPAHTFTPLNLYDVLLKTGAELQLKLQSGHNTGIFLRNGTMTINNNEQATGPVFILFKPDGDTLLISNPNTDDANFLVLGGAPINEPVASYGPFVMNTDAEIKQAFADYRSGKMGHLSAE